MRIGISINTSWNIYNFRERLVRHLISQGHEVIAIAPKDQYSEILKEWGCKYIDLPMYATSANPITELKLIFNYIKIIRKEQVEVLLTFTIKPNLYGTLASKVCKIPIICNVSGLGTVFLTRDLKSSVARILYKMIFRHSNFIFFQNPYDQKLFLKKFSVNELKTAVLPGSGIDLEKYKKLPYRPADKITFLMISRVILEKGVREFAYASLALIKRGFSVNCVLIGRHEELHSRSISRDELDRWIEAGLIYKGHTDKIINEIENADVVVLPSYREGMSRTLLESAASGRPLIASDVPGCNDIVQNNVNGLLCEVKSSEDLLKKMEDFLHLSDEQKRSFADESRKIAEKYYDEKKVVLAYTMKINEFDKKETVKK